MNVCTCCTAVVMCLVIIMLVKYACTYAPGLSAEGMIFRLASVEYCNNSLVSSGITT